MYSGRHTTVLTMACAQFSTHAVRYAFVKISQLKIILLAWTKCCSKLLTNKWHNQSNVTY